jgi:hypothetical protein
MFTICRFIRQTAAPVSSKVKNMSKNSVKKILVHPNKTKPNTKKVSNQKPIKPQILGSNTYWLNQPNPLDTKIEEASKIV